MLSLLLAWTSCWRNNQVAGDLKTITLMPHHCNAYFFIIMLWSLETAYRAVHIHNSNKRTYASGRFNPWTAKIQGFVLSTDCWWRGANLFMYASIYKLTEFSSHHCSNKFINNMYKTSATVHLSWRSKGAKVIKYCTLKVQYRNICLPCKHGIWACPGHWYVVCYSIVHLSL